MWRPPNWDETMDEVATRAEGDVAYWDAERLFEAGADAMLKALIQKGYVSQVTIATITGSDIISE